jgi:hypothetical protein
MPNWLLWALYAIREDQIAAALVHVARNGYQGDIVSAQDLSALGMKLLDNRG